MGKKKERGGPEAIGPIVRDIISSLGLEELAASSKVFEIWQSVVGPAIAGHTRPHSFLNGTLIVHVDSSVWLAQLDRFRKNQIKEKLNKCLLSPAVKRIIFRSGEVKEAR